MQRVRGDDWLGLNVTIPYKQFVLGFVEGASDDVIACSAVNTVVKQLGILYAHNTDVAGFSRALESSGFDASGVNAVILGYGGAARAAMVALNRAGARQLTVFARDYTECVRHIGELQETMPGTVLVPGALANKGALSRSLRSAALLVNATPVGMRGGGAEEKSLVPPRLLHANLTVFDAVYNPLQTPLLRYADQVGARAINGLDMLVYQGAGSFKLWTGQDAPIEVMRKAAREALEG
jgi:shikimate dehydrogenase